VRTALAEALDGVVAELKDDLGIAAACRAVGASRASWHRRHRKSPAPARPAPVPHRERVQPQALSEAEATEVLSVLESDRFAEASPAHIAAELLDEGVYLCSPATMYRLMRRTYGQVIDRRRQARHPARTKPELVATGPNQVWSWDITKLKGHTKWRYHYLYVVLDIYSRYVVAWMVAPRESSALAKELLSSAIEREGVDPETLTVHADNGSSMASKPVAFLLADLGVTKTHSRPRVSNDNPYSESQFKTLKYCPAFPDRFTSIEDARAFCTRFFNAYNHDHRHSGIAMLTPATVHTGRAEQVIAERQAVLDAAFNARPDRFRGRRPRHPCLAEAAWINPPEPEKTPTTSETELVTQPKNLTHEG
jgi:putative transposase